MSNRFAEFDESGRIKNVIEVFDSESYINFCLEREIKIIPIDKEANSTELLTEFYVKDNLLIKRPKFILDIEKEIITADNIDFTTIRNIPINSKIKVDDFEFVCTDDFFEFSTGTVGFYDFYIENFPYIPLNFVIEAKENLIED